MNSPGLKDFANNERAASAIEFAFLAPVLLMVLVGTVTLFDLFRNAQSVEKATFTIGDILSRQTSINTTMLNFQLTTIREMVPAALDGGVRISSVSRKGSKLELLWTRTVGSNGALGSDAIPYDLVPDMANGDSVILVETFVPHDAMVPWFGLDAITFKARSAHRPRFVSAIAFN